ncbi:MAG: ABC transporter permease [bacterium]
MRLNFEKRKNTPAWLKGVLALAAVLISLLLSSSLILWAGASPLEAYLEMFRSSLGNWLGLSETLVKAAPLLLTGLAVAVAFRARFWNIGAEGQLYAGALAATFLGLHQGSLPAPLAIPLAILGAMILGGLWALFPAWLKTRFRVDDVVSTLLLNYVFILFVGAMVTGPWRDKVTNWPQSAELPESFWFPVLLTHSRIHLGVLLALIAALFIWFLIGKTVLGFEIGAVGAGEKAARFAGIDIRRTFLLTALLSGSLAGLAGAGELLGLHHHLIEKLSPGYGYSGIVVATLGALNPLGAVFSALFVATVVTGADAMSRFVGIPSYIGDVIQGLALLSALALFFLAEYRVRVEK